MRITVFGLGEAGSLIAADLAAAGADVHGYDPADVATPTDVTRHASPDTAVEESTLVLGITAAADATEALTQALDALAPDVIYADLSTSPPGWKHNLAGTASGHGLVFADVALMGTVPVSGLATPAFASGPGAVRFADMVNTMGARVEVLGDEPGEAAARKLLRSVVTKGLTSVLMESLEAGDAFGTTDWLWPHLVEFFTNADEDLLRRLVEGTPPHVDRRIEEMEAAEAFLESLGVTPTMTGATVDALRRLRSESRQTLIPNSDH